VPQGPLCEGGRPLPRAYDPRVPHPPTALAWAGGSLAAVLVVGMLGPSAAVPPLGRNGNAGAVVVTALLAAAVVAGIAAVLLGLRAGRTPRGAPWLAAAAVTALVAVSPVGNADLLSYAAYGRVGVTRADPYATPPQPSRDPVRQQVEDPWRTTPSVYGPVATLEQIAVARVVGDRPLLLPRALAAVNGLLFWLVGLLLWRRSPCRAVWLWWLNPVLLLVLVGGAHLDAAVALLVLLSCTHGAGGRVAAVAGALSVKATAAWAVLGLFTGARSPPCSVACSRSAPSHWPAPTCLTRPTAPASTSVPAPPGARSPARSSRSSRTTWRGPSWSASRSPWRCCCGDGSSAFCRRGSSWPGPRSRRAWPGRCSRRPPCPGTTRRPSLCFPCWPPRATTGCWSGTPRCCRCLPARQSRAAAGVPADPP